MAGPVIHTYRAAEPGLNVNSYLVEAESGVVVVDTSLHGAPAGPGVLAEQRRYLLYYRELVRRLADGEPRLPEAAKAELDAGMQSFLPDAPLTWMIGLGADAVAAELARAEAG